MIATAICHSKSEENGPYALEIHTAEGVNYHYASLYSKMFSAEKQLKKIRKHFIKGRS